MIDWSIGTWRRKSVDGWTDEQASQASWELRVTYCLFAVFIISCSSSSSSFFVFLVFVCLAFEEYRERIHFLFFFSPCPPFLFFFSFLFFFLPFFLLFPQISFYTALVCVLLNSFFGGRGQPLPYLPIFPPPPDSFASWLDFIRHHRNRVTCGINDGWMDE